MQYLVCMHPNIVAHKTHAELDGKDTQTLKKCLTFIDTQSALHSKGGGGGISSSTIIIIHNFIISPSLVD